MFSGQFEVFSGLRIVCHSELVSESHNLFIFYSESHLILQFLQLLQRLFAYFQQVHIRIYRENYVRQQKRS